ncbi:TetR/AcrR family transcriptional regulator [Pseudomonas sp. ZM23]|uniref:Helix-turn-helix domain containing protein n=1 Tax=Pseudomonas triclosanedens TaxID=2961893 RepID=A0ABY6ZQM6_9PSED|nr:TetR/AcrR family transcriptional regulator [Pseudomonas triclosanedens]MCP8467623.1 TetR/AcrR family transcriptional regulator [Pseudomonas triclosanedens]MCP8473369.1 TetR/AcrR family transcriptional regulator [Pseudomonas triclosanedens]MCP8479398.1 TetR/AcrR family transcriptional regulator [Pseudomonas triclosanedens]WAI47091.1 helix-turn-helix domain containing protein [Pseudomonas triclosanedens]
MTDRHTRDDSTAPLTRGHKKRARTRQGLLDAALRVFARQDVAATALQDLAVEAEVSTGTIYNYFRTREELAEAVGIELAGEFSETISELSRHIDSGSKRLAIGVRMFVLRAQSDPQWASALLRVIHFDQAMHSTLASHVRDDLRGGLAEGVFHYANEDIALDLVISCATGAIRATLEGRTHDEQDILLAEMVLRALGATPARARKIAALPLPQDG